MEIVKSSAGRWYVKDYNKVTKDISNNTVNKIADQCGSYRFTVSGYITFGKESDCKKFESIVRRIKNIPKELKTFLKKEKAYDLFVLNFHKGCGETLTNAFVWENSNEGYEFWSNLSKKYNENQLQNKTVDRSGDDRSEGDRVCCKGDESRFRLSYTQHRKTINFRKREAGDFKVNLSARHSVLL